MARKWSFRKGLQVKKKKRKCWQWKGCEDKAVAYPVLPLLQDKSWWCRTDWWAVFVTYAENLELCCPLSLADLVRTKEKLTSSLKYIASAPPCWSVADWKRLRKQISSKLCSAFLLQYRRSQIWINKLLLLCMLLRFWMLATGRSNDYSGLWLLPISVAPNWGKGIEAASHNRRIYKAFSIEGRLWDDCECLTLMEGCVLPGLIHVSWFYFDAVSEDDFTH